MTKIPSTDLATVRPLRELYFELGRSLLTTARGREALDFLQKALDAEGDFPETWEIRYLLGKAYQADKELNKAFRTYLQAIVETPDVADILLPFAHQLLTRSIAVDHQKWIDEHMARLVGDARLDRQDRIELILFMGRTRLLLQKHAEALEVFRLGHQLEPEDTRVLEGLGESLWLDGKPEQALELLKRAGEQAAAGQYPERAPLINLRLVRILIAQGEYRPALERIEASPESPDYRFELLVARGICYLGLGQPEEAVRIAEQALQEHGSSVQAHLLRARALLALHRYSEALETIDGVLTQDPTNLDLAFLKIQAAIEAQQNSENALHQLDRLLKRKDHGFTLLREYLASPLLAARRDDGNAQYFLARIHYHLFPNWTLNQVLEEVDRALELGLSAGSAEQDLEIGAYLLKAEVHERKRQKEPAAAAYFEAAKKVYDLGEQESAARYFQRSLDLEPDNYLCCWYLADSYRILSYRDSAPYVEEETILKSLEVWNRGAEIKTEPDEDESWTYVARAYISEQLAQLPDRDRWLEIFTALAYAERALLHIDNSDRWAVLSRFYGKTYLLANALLASGRAAEMDPDDLTVMQEKAGNLIDTGLYDEANELVDRLIDYYSGQGDEASANYYRGWSALICYYRAEYPRALELINRGMETARDDIWNRNLRAYIYGMLHDLERASQDHAWILEKLQDPNYRDDALYSAWSTFHLGRLDESIQYSQQALEEPDGLCEGYLNLARIYLVKGDLARARENLEEALKAARDLRVLDNARIDFEFLLWRSRHENWPNAAEMRQAVTGPGGFMEQVEQAQRELRRRLEQRSPVQEAIQELEKVLSAADGPADHVAIAARAGLARLYQESQSWDKALAAYRWLADPDRSFPEAWLGLENVATAMIAAAEGLLDSGEQNEGQALLDQAGALLLELLRARPERDASMYELADEYFLSLGQPDRAVDLFTKIREIKGEDNEASYQNRLGNVYYYQEDYAAAEEHYRKAIEADPTQAVYYTNLAGSLRYQKRWDEARQYLARAFEINAREVDYNREVALTHNSQGVDFFDRGLNREAIQAYTRAVELDPDDPVFYSNIALAHSELENWAQAVEYYRIAVEKSGGDAEYQRRLALAYNDLGNYLSAEGDSHSAAEQYQKAIELVQDDPVIYANLGLTYLDLERWEDALESFKNAYEIDKDEHLYNLRVAQVHAAMGSGELQEGE